MVFFELISITFRVMAAIKFQRAKCIYPCMHGNAPIYIQLPNSDFVIIIGGRDEGQRSILNSY